MITRSTGTTRPTGSTHPATARAVPPLPGTPTAAATPYPDPVDGLLHAAAAHRPLEDVARLITMLEQSEECTDAAAGVLRAAGTTRSLEDVSRLVTVLSRAPHPADHTGHMIRAAAEHRPVEEVAELVGRLTREREREREGRRPMGPPPTAADTGASRPGRSAEPARATRWTAASALAVCGISHIPVHPDGVPLTALVIAWALSVLCLLAAVPLTRGSAPLPTAAAVAGVLVPLALLAAQLLSGRVAALAGLPEAALAPPWAGAATAVCAALTALCVLLARVFGDRHDRDAEPRDGGLVPEAGATD
ncbi:hypothetical protein ACFU3O_20795 [Streptomyces antibioticus]|uniref:hypothetical protein n=1 Tax=Streptomyces antibioticus TaxID=1890 RepID=UPI0036CD581B